MTPNLLIVDETVESLAAFSKDIAANIKRKEATIKNQAAMLKQSELTKILQSSPDGQKASAAIKTHLSEKAKENRTKEKLALAFLSEFQENIQKLRD